MSILAARLDRIKPSATMAVTQKARELKARPRGALNRSYGNLRAAVGCLGVGVPVDCDRVGHWRAPAHVLQHALPVTQWSALCPRLRLPSGSMTT